MYTFSMSPERLALAVLLALATGWALGQWWRARELRRNKSKIQKEFKEIIEDAKRTGQAIIADAELQGKQITIDERERLEREIKGIRDALTERERAINSRSDAINSAEADLERRRAKLDKAYDEIRLQESRASELEAMYESKLEELSGLNMDSARALILSTVESSAKNEAARITDSIYTKAKATAEFESQRIITTCMERISRQIVADKTTCIVPLKSPDMKGRIIGKDGRNIRAFEAISGVDVLLEEIPEHVVLSSHSPERREVAKLVLEDLMQDGRIQPSRIEEFFKLATPKLEARCLELGKEALREFGFPEIGDEVALTLGKLNLRTSYSQNVLLHSKETAHIGGLLAAEIGLNVKVMQRACLLHDIGKALSEDFVGPHAIVGAEFLKKHGESPTIINAVAAHHGEAPEESPYAPLLKTADALSGARPGARRENLEAYIKRLEDMEKIASSFKGVESAFALQAGRELRIIVLSDVIHDEQTKLLAHEIALKLQTELRYAGDMKITVIRETRATELATWQ